MSRGILVIRADASIAAGTGHVMRCLALAQEWQDRDGRAAFVVAEATQAIRERVAAEGFDVLSTAIPAGTTDDSARTIALAQELGAHWVVVDGYQFGAEYQHALKSAGLTLLFLDDYGHSKQYDADLVLNQNLSANSMLYSSRESGTSLLLGLRYCLLRREFMSWRDWEREITPSGRRVLVTMGGSDPKNLTGNVIEALSRVEIEDLEAVVVIGGSNPRADALEDSPPLAAKNISVRRDVTNIAELMAWADVAVSSAGSTCWELCLLGLPSLLYDAAENQKPIAHQLSQRGCAIHLGCSGDFDSDVLVLQLESLLRSTEIRQVMSLRCRELVDGKGAQRVTSIMQSGLRLRPAEKSDRELLWKWANDPQVRASAFASAAIPIEQHDAWFASNLNNPNCLILIAEDHAGTAVGQFRVDWRSAQEGEIDVSIASDRRGAGYGSVLIELGVSRAFAEKGERLHAFVKSENRPSRRAFEQAGFSKAGEEIVHDQRAIHYVRSTETS
jgi:UDP-2,4-diacetamido-2,4,6-trideoxy-beta-L-altropyranose hydrolase